MIKRIFLLFLALLFILSVGFIIVSAEDNITETSTAVETTVSEPSSNDNNITLTDINQKMIFIIFGLFCIVGCLIAQGFSFWKW